MKHLESGNPRNFNYDCFLNFLSRQCFYLNREVQILELKSGLDQKSDEIYETNYPRGFHVDGFLNYYSLVHFLSFQMGVKSKF